MTPEHTIPSVHGPALFFVSPDRADGSSTVTRIDLQQVTDPRERAICRALLDYAVGLINHTEFALPDPQAEFVPPDPHPEAAARVEAVVARHPELFPDPSPNAHADGSEPSEPVCYCGDPTCVNAPNRQEDCPGHEECLRCDVLDPCPCCGLRYIDGRWVKPRNSAEAAEEAGNGKLRQSLDDVIKHRDQLKQKLTEIRRLLPTIARALEQLPSQCQYHQDRLDPERPFFGREACCDTGVPARRRREAFMTLTSLTLATETGATL